MKPKRLNRDIYVVELTIKKTKSAIYPGSRTGYQLYPIRYRKLSTCVRGKYKVRGVRRNMNGQKRRRVLAVTALIKLGYGKLPQQRGRTLTPESAGRYPVGTALINPGARAARPAGPGLPAGGDAADYRGTIRRCGAGLGGVRFERTTMHAGYGRSGCSRVGIVCIARRLIG